MEANSTGESAGYYEVKAKIKTDKIRKGKKTRNEKHN